MKGSGFCFGLISTKMYVSMILLHALVPHSRLWPNTNNESLNVAHDEEKEYTPNPGTPNQNQSAHTVEAVPLHVVMAKMSRKSLKADESLLG